MIELHAELGKYTVLPGEHGPAVKFSIETRLEDCPTELVHLGIALDKFIVPKEAEASKIVYGNIPLLNQPVVVKLCDGDGHNCIKLGRLSIDRAEIIVKDVDKQTIAVLKITLSDIFCPERLNSWLHHNSGKIITIELEQVQQDLPYMDAVNEFKEGCKKMVADPDSGVTGVSIKAGGKKVKVA